jgi:hypothetical protein
MECAFLSSLLRRRQGIILRDVKARVSRQWPQDVVLPLPHGRRNSPKAHAEHSQLLCIHAETGNQSVDHCTDRSFDFSFPVQALFCHQPLPRQIDQSNRIAAFQIIAPL